MDSFAMDGGDVAVDPSGAFLLAVRTLPADALLALAGAVRPAVVAGAGMPGGSTGHVDDGGTHEALDLGREGGGGGVDAGGDGGGGGGGGVVGGFGLGDDVDLVGFEDLVGPGDADAATAGEGAAEALGGGPVADLARRRGFGVRVGLGGEGAVAEFVAALLAALPVVFFREAGFGEAHELVEDGEFELELDGVDHGFDGGFADVVIGELQPDEDDVHTDADAVDQEELQHDFPRHAVVDGPQESDGRGDVDGGDDEFLHAKARELDAFHDVELGCPVIRHGRVAPVRKDDCWDVQGAGVKDDHEKHDSKSALVADDEVKARVEHERLPRHHCHPS